MVLRFVYMIFIGVLLATFLGVLVVSLTLFKRIFLLADGLLLGGVLVLVYSIVRGFGTEDNMFRFLVVSVGFAVSLTLGYLKFIKPAGAR